MAISLWFTNSHSLVVLLSPKTGFNRRQSLHFRKPVRILSLHDLNLEDMSGPNSIPEISGLSKLVTHSFVLNAFPT